MCGGRGHPRGSVGLAGLTTVDPWALSDECYYESCEDCHVPHCAHHCHDSVYFDWPTIRWRRMETVAVTATDENGDPVI